MNQSDYRLLFSETYGKFQNNLSEKSLLIARSLSFRVWQTEPGLKRKDIQSWVETKLEETVARRTAKAFHEMNVQVFSDLSPAQVYELAVFFEEKTEGRRPFPFTYRRIVSNTAISTRAEKSVSIYDNTDYREVREPRILLMDIETTPLIGTAWKIYDTNLIEVIQESHILCFSHKWWSKDDTSTPEITALTDYPDLFEEDLTDDSRVCHVLYDLLNEADIVIAHNGVRFDTKKIKARLAFHGIPNPSPFAQVDTLNTARRHFSFSSNKLNDLGVHLGLGKKLPHAGYSLWKGCMNGDPKSWQVMRDYNVQDVSLLESVYEFFLFNGYMDNHPNVANISGQLDACPKCLAPASELVATGVEYTKTITYSQVLCNVCSSTSRVRRTNSGPNLN